MIKKYKKDILAVSLLITFTIIVYYLLTKDGNLFASTLDFEKQHVTFPEYFRSLFYETQDLLPDFMPNLGAGQNIYSVSYYGLLNPVYMISYLLPSVSMMSYINFVSITSCVISSILLYFYFKKNNKSSLVSFLGAFILLCASPLLFHSHRHIMFINYMPFLILGLYGIDRYIDKKRSLLLIVSLTLIIFSSYFFSVGALIALFIYGIYKYISRNKLNIKKLILFKLRLCIPFIISVLISAIILIPTLYVLVSGRLESESLVTLSDLFTPQSFMLYSNYNMGLTPISLILLVFIIIKGKKEHKILGVFLLLISFIPIFNYILNGFMYINGKALIPFIPLVIILVVEALSYIYVGKFKSYHYLLAIYIILSVGLNCIEVNLSDDLIVEEDYTKELNEYTNDIENILKNDESYYRINNTLYGLNHINTVSDINEYKTTLYSSTFNTNYQKFYTETIDNNVKYRNMFVTNASQNIFSHMYFGEKYIISNINYDNVYEKMEDNIYINNYALPVGYATTNNINIDDFEKLTNEEKMVNVVGNTITNEETNIKIKTLEGINNDYEYVTSEKIEIEKTEEGYRINAEEEGNISLTNANFEDGDIIIINFDIESQTKDLSISIDGILNKLTDSEWKYYNNNEEFNYVLTNGKNIEIKFSEGIFNISNIKVSKINISEFDSILNDVTPLNVNLEKTKGDFIYGNISLEEESYLHLSIPYDEGFKLFINDKEVEYEKINETFIGIKLNEGEHDLKIEYVAPYKNIASYISISSIIIALIYLMLERRIKK